ncbi:MAG TPA: hypothetical protein VIJ50_13365 [Solirubrobacteraceae bacterium]
MSATDGTLETPGPVTLGAAEAVAAGGDVVAGVDTGAAVVVEEVAPDATPGSAVDLATGVDVGASEPSAPLGSGMTRGATVDERLVPAEAVTAPVGPPGPTGEAACGEAGSAPAAVVGPDTTAVLDGSPGSGMDVVSGANVDRCASSVDVDVGVAPTGTPTVVEAAVPPARVLASGPPS